MAKNLDGLLHGLGVNPHRKPATVLPWERRRGRGFETGLPLAFVKRLQTDSELRDLMAGVGGGNKDRSGSGKDMVLAHYLKRHGFPPDEVRRILPAAGYPVDGGRTEAYLDRTVRKVFESPAARARRRTEERANGFGQLSARLLDGTWAELSFIAKALYGVFAIRCMRPSLIVRDSPKQLAAWAGIGQDSVGRAATELVEKGLLRRARHPKGVNYWLISPPPCRTVGAVGVPEQRADHSKGEVNRGRKSNAA
jgi:hypothetical protein